MSAGGVLFLHAQTAVHPGTGQALGAVDLPVARERHTGWPLIPGSSLKGVLRAACRSKVARSNGGDLEAADREARLAEVFGPSLGRASKTAWRGSLGVSDARLLAFPVRSLRGVFAWVTCPGVLQRFTADLALCGLQAPVWPGGPPAVKEQEALAVPDSPLIHDGRLVFEDMVFTTLEDAGLQAELQTFAEWLAEVAIRREEAFSGGRERLSTNLVVISDEEFTYLSQYATEVEARIALDYESKVVKEGLLFSQELLPPETILYTLLLSLPVDGPGPRGDGPARYLEEVGVVPGVLQVGSDETTGKGICQARLLCPGGAPAGGEEGAG